MSEPLPVVGIKKDRYALVGNKSVVRVDTMDKITGEEDADFPIAGCLLPEPVSVNVAGNNITI
jgi:hypothetical protein